MATQSVSPYGLSPNPFLDTPDIPSENASSSSAVKGLEDPLLNPPSHDLLLEEEGFTGQRESRISFDELQLPPRSSEVTDKYVKWSLRGLGLATAAGFLVLRVMDCSRKINAWSSFMVGLGAGTAFEAGRTNVNHSWRTKYALTLLGQTFIMFQTQIFDNLKYPASQAFNAHSIIGATGFMAALVAYQLFLSRFAMRSEGHAGSIYTGKKLQPPFFSPAASNVLKMGAIGGATLFHFMLTDPTAKSIALFFITFYSGQIAGFMIAHAVNKMIVKNLQPNLRTIEEVQGSRWQTLQTILNTAGFLAIPGVLIPWAQDTATASRLTWFPIMGVVMGLFEELMYRNMQERLHKFPINQLGELQVLKPPGQEEFERTGKVPLTLELHNKIWRVVVPTLVISAFIGFTIWQDGFDLQYPDQKAELGAMLGGFLITLGLAYYADSKWEPEKEGGGWKQYFIEKTMTSFLISPRILGVNPMDFYFIGLNAYIIGTESPVSNDTNKKVVATAAYIFLGIAWALEFIRTWGNRRGTVLFFPMMALVNGATVMEKSIQGSNGMP